MSEIGIGAAGVLLVAAAALIDGDGRVLVAQRARAPHAGLWEFPGGKIEAGETPEAALVRELAEELGIMVDHSCLAPAAFATGEAGGRNLVLLLFVLRKWRGVPQPLDATALRWERPLALHALAMPPADRPLIALLEALI